MGKYCGYSFLASSNANKVMYAYSYMLKYERQPFRVVFLFYKANDKWNLYSFSLDDEIDDELKNALKIH